MHESFHHEMAKTMNDLIFLSAIVSEMFFQFSTSLCTLTLGVYYYSNDDKCLAEKRLFTPFLPALRYSPLKLQPHTMKTNFFVNSLPLFVMTSRKEFFILSTKAYKRSQKWSKAYRYSTYIEDSQGIKVKKKARFWWQRMKWKQKKSTFVLESVLLRLHVTRFFVPFSSFHLSLAFMVFWFWLKPFDALNYSENLCWKKSSWCERNYECLLKRRSWEKMTKRDFI